MKCILKRLYLLSFRRILQSNVYLNDYTSFDQLYNEMHIPTIKRKPIT
jgi:hypothetical protein